MELFREYFWLFVVLGMVFVSVMIVILFICINKCITRRAEEYKINCQRSANNAFYAGSSQYHPKQLEEDLPPLPARNPILPSCTPSYEDIANLPDYVKVDEKAAPPLNQSTTPPVQREACPDRTSVSTEAYDDIVLPGYESEDYDDVE